MNKIIFSTIDMTPEEYAFQMFEKMKNMAKS